MINRNPTFHAQPSTRGFCLLFPVSVVVLSCFADSTDTLLGQILVEQRASLADALKSDYAYTMTHKGFETSGNGARSTISAKFSVVRQGDNLRVTKEHYPVIVLPEAKGGWYQELRMERLVSNRELTAVWSNVAVPEIYLYYSSDWAAPGQSKRHDLTVGVINPVATAFSVETDDGTLIDMIEREGRLPIERRPRWEVEITPSTNGTPEYILRRYRPEFAGPDLVLTIDPAKNCAITHTEFYPGGIENAVYERQCSKEYQKVGGKWVLVRCEIIEMENEGLLGEVVCEVSEVSLSPSAPETSFTLEGLQLPNKALLWRRHPVENGQERMEASLLENGVQTLVHESDLGDVLADLGLIEWHGRE